MGRTPYGEQSPKRAIARALKASGMSYAQVGGKMGISRQRAQQLVAPLPSVRSAMIEKAGGVCECCGGGGPLHAHHASYEDGPSKILCPSCHRNEHLGVTGNPLTRLLASLKTQADWMAVHEKAIAAGLDFDDYLLLVATPEIGAAQ